MGGWIWMTFHNRLVDIPQLIFFSNLNILADINCIKTNLLFPQGVLGYVLRYMKVMF